MHLLPKHFFAILAQLGEHRIHIPKVNGSIPLNSTAWQMLELLVKYSMSNFLAIFFILSIILYWLNRGTKFYKLFLLLLIFSFLALILANIWCRFFCSGLDLMMKGSNWTCFLKTIFRGSNFGGTILKSLSGFIGTNTHISRSALHIRAAFLQPFSFSHRFSRSTGSIISWVLFLNYQSGCRRLPWVLGHWR